MNRYFYAVALVFLFAVDACRSRQQSTAQAADSTATTSPADAKTAEPAITTRLADLGLTADSHWRGINLGDDFGRVKTTEKGEPFESDARHVGYTVEFENLETADVLYYQKDQKVSAIDVDLFLNNRASVDAYQKELSTYFTTRYGTPKSSLGSSVWNGPAGEQITLNDVSKGKDFGLKLKLAPTTSAATASTR